MPVEITWAIQLPLHRSVLLAGASMFLGVAVYLFALNRSLNYLRDGGYKFPLVVSTFLVMLASFGWLGYVLDPRFSAWLVGGGFGLLGLGEVRRMWIYSRSLGDPPVAQNGPALDWRKPVTTTALQGVHFKVPLAGWSGQPFRVVQLSDFHLNKRLPRAYYEAAVQQANQAQADLVFITGDFVTGLDCIEQLPGLLQGLHSRCGVYGILGNHDYWAGAKQVVEAAQRGGVQMLPLEGREVDLGHEPTIWLAGCDAPWSKERCQIPEIPAGQCVIALSHSADYIYPLSRAGVKAVFSGHFHAGQFQLPILGPVLVPSRYGRLFYRGHFMVKGTHLFVSAGIGCAEPALRLYCPPDILVVDFTSAGSSAPDRPG
jgi:predicted MPP superfamily phosphohydrolase